MQVVIVGGGLAGTITALHLQAVGVDDIRVLERSARVGTTACGEGLSAATIGLLRPVFDATPFIDGTFRGARWAFPGTRVTVHWPCHTMAREDWIPAMADAVKDNGGTIETGARIKAADLEALEADVVVGADGPGSQVRRCIPGARVKTRLGLQVRLETDHQTPWLEFVTDKRFSREYAWWFPRSDAHNVGLLAEGDGQDWDRLEAFIDQLALEGHITRRESYPIAYGGRRFVSPDGRYALIGDAAGLTNPVTKGGMAAIIHAAPLLAAAIARGRPANYQRALATHPLTHRCFKRSLRRLRRWDNQRIAAAVKPVPAEVAVGGPSPTPLLRAGARVVARKPWLAASAKTFYDAGRLSLRYSW